jgi:pimeloyl-ACP methyl ester carboxylesterase
MRLLARLLARAGVHAFRFDYFGTGDSDGTDLESSLSRAADDAGAAIDELKDTAAVRKVTLIGLRIGAVVAARAAAARRDVDRLVLWDPVFDGEKYLDEIADDDAAHAKLKRAASGSGQPVPVRGFLMAPDALAGIAEVSVHSFDTRLPSVLVVSTHSAGACGPLVDHLARAGTQVHSQFHAGPQAWVEIGNFGASGMPVGAIQAIVKWVTT